MANVLHSYRTMLDPNFCNKYNESIGNKVQNIIKIASEIIT